jgi:acetylglutamate kinase
MVLSGLANKQMVSALVAAGAPAVGISGEDAALLRATPIDTAQFGHSGTPALVNPGVVHALLHAGYLPVISPVAARAHAGEAGAYNVNGDDAAAAIAAALGATELFLMADVPGVLDGDKQRIATLTLDDARALVTSGVAGGGMAAKLDACAMALAGGVTRVRIGDLAALTVPAAGTAIVARVDATDTSR